MMNKVRNVILTVLVILLLYALLVVKPAIRKALRNHTFTSCKVYKVGRKRIYCKYSVDDKSYRTSKRTFNGINEFVQYGELFKVKYATSNPDYHELYFFQPLIVDLDKYTEGETNEVVLVGRNTIKYSYEFNNKKYYRIQEFNDSMNIDVNTRYNVMILLDNPKQSYVCLDSINCWDYFKEKQENPLDTVY